jgi:branched-subunit amino acid aminotransferase/4-amino-4-deoxychorismate lyase
MRVLIDGVEVSEDEAAVSVFDWAVQRGFGCFEVIRSYRGIPFRMDAHLDRLARSAGAIGLVVPDRAALESWIVGVAGAGGDCQVRVMLTGGGRDPLVAAPPRAVVAWEPLPDVPTPLRLMPLEAPWHPGSSAGPFSGVKWLSYAPNMASGDLARASGFDDALLLSREGWVIEGPTFTVAWVREGVLETPTLELGILASITRSVVLAEARRRDIDVREGRFPLQRIQEADEAMGLSTLKEVLAIGAIGEVALGEGPVTAAMQAAYRSVVSAETT